MRLDFISTAAVTLATLISASGAAFAQTCWTDVSAASCTGREGQYFHVLQFKNNCSGGQRSIDVCVRWTGGPNTGVQYFTGLARGGDIAFVTPGVCKTRFRYNWNPDGSRTSC